MDVIDSLLKADDAGDESATTASTLKASSLPPSLFALFNKFQSQSPSKAADTTDGQSEPASSGSPRVGEATDEATDEKRADRNATGEQTVEQQAAGGHPSHQTAAEAADSPLADELLKARPYFATLNPLGSVDFRLRECMILNFD
jgi:hypothetical protein